MNSVLIKNSSTNVLLDAEKIDAIKTILHSKSREYWAFKGARREHTHGLLQYPAMMVPQLQNEIIEIFLQYFPEIKSVYDPFVGSGTIMTEAMMHGLAFAGQDINPLAILICYVKKGPFKIELLKKRLKKISDSLQKDDGTSVDISFNNMDKWFTLKNKIELSKIYRNILKERSLVIRRFLWICLAEVVRQTSNSRTSTFKLHIRPTKEIEEKLSLLSPVNLFLDQVQYNCERLSEIAELLLNNNLLEKHKYKKQICIKYKSILTGGVSQKYQYDLLMTSPPYGDNTTTVPYGQYSYLPLQWISQVDLPCNIKSDFLKSTREIDRVSLGGGLANKDKILKNIAKKSDTLKLTLDKLKNDTQGRQYKVAIFFHDMDSALKHIIAQLKPNAFMIFTLGNRRVADMPVPMNLIMRELLEKKGASFITEIERDIPSKRMAPKNKTTDTMTMESILIMQNKVML